MSARSRVSALVRAASSSRQSSSSLNPRCATFSSSSQRHRSSRRDERPAILASVRTDASKTSYVPPPPPPLNTPSRSDDDLLKAHFDLPFSPSPRSTSSSSLFSLPPLSSPLSLRPLTDRTLVHARHIVQRICSAPSDPTGRELRLVVKNLDRLSDLLCGVIDMCELVRNVHPDEQWIQEAERAYERLCSFMNGLNTDQSMYKALVITLEHRFPNPLSSAEIQVALTFLRDFERSGIHLPPAIRARFVELSDSLLSLGRTFLSFASAGPNPEPPIEIPDPARLLSGMGSQFIDGLTRRRGKVYVTPGSWEAQMISRHAREGEARRLVYVGGLRKEPYRVQVLERLLKQRSELAHVLGKETWADVVLTDKMAKTPANVMRFLSSLAAHHRPAAAADIATLRRIKAANLAGTQIPGNEVNTRLLPPISAWDREFYSERHLMSVSPTSSLPSITPYFSTGTVLLGLSRLFSCLYGISFRPIPVAPGEVWHNSVRRIDVIDEAEGQIGVIYCDLFSRAGKPPSAAHYTVRCSRRVDDDDLAGDRLPQGWDQAYGPGLETDGQAAKGKEGRYQLPIVVLTTDFGTVEEGGPALLGWNDIETLFHEMGHAIHSMIGRTEYHNVSGTRCSTDFVELPSILMEHFVSSPAVLSLFASHYATGEPVPLPLIQAHLNLQSSLSAIETHGQILMAILDQKYHSLRLADLDSFDSTRVHADLHDEIGVMSPVTGTAWQTQFGHLYGYGATYYSYLFDRAIAGKVWSTLFNSTPDGSLSREGGEILKARVLRWGGGKDPWEMVGSVVGGHEGEMVAKGDEKAMGLVGRWLIK